MHVIKRTNILVVLNHNSVNKRKEVSSSAPPYGSEIGNNGF